MIVPRAFIAFLILLSLALDLYGQGHTIKDKMGTSFNRAIQEHDSTAIAKLLKNGVNPNITNKLGISLLTLAIRNHNNASIIKMLISAGADVNEKMISGVSVLMSACYDSASSTIIDMLIKAGANVNATDLTEMTPLMWATSAGNLDAVKLLLAAGADVNATDQDGSVAIDNAIGENRQDIVKLLVQAGASPYGSDAPIVDYVDSMGAPKSFRELLSTSRAFHKSIEDVVDWKENVEAHATSAQYSAWLDDSLQLFADSLKEANELLRWYLVKNLPRTPGALTDTAYSKDGLAIVTAPDGKLREWHWNNWTGGTMPEYDQLIEYQSPSGIRIVDQNSVSPEDNQHNSWYDTIFEVHKANGKPVYLPVEAFQEWSTMGGEFISAFEIGDSSLIYDSSFFQTKKGRVSTIGIETHSIDSDIVVVPNGPTLFVPVVNKEYYITTKRLRYEFDGDHFVYQGISK